jgi:hypothetical protein
MSTYDDETPLEFFEEPETVESPGRQRRRVRSPRGGGPRRPTPPPPGAVALARLAGLVALAIAVVVGLVFWVGSCQGKSRHDEYKSYMDAVQPIAQRSAAPGTQMPVVFRRVHLTLAGLQAQFEQWAQEQQQDYDDALRLVPPAPLQAAHQQVLATFQLRAIAFTDIANTLAQPGSKTSLEIGARLAHEARLLGVSDTVWTELFKLPATETLKRVGVIGVIAPPSRIVPNAEVLTANSFGTVYSRLQAASNTGPVTGVHGSVLLSTEAVTGSKVTQLTHPGPTTVDVAADLKFKVSFKNGGNSLEANVPVTLSIGVGGKVVRHKKKVVLFIEPGATKTVSFANVSPPNSAFGASATVDVEIGKVRGETTLSDNKASYPVFFSLSSGG